MDVAAKEINAAGGVDGRRIEIIHVDAKSDLNLSATAALEAIEKGADVVVPMCDADLGAPGARAANEKGVLAITCAGAPGLGRQAVGPLTFNTYAGAPTEGAISAEYAYETKGWRTAYLLCDQSVEYTKVLCSAFETRWRELGGEVAGKDTFLQSDTSDSRPGHAPAERGRARRRAAGLLPGGLAGTEGDSRRVRGPDRARRRVRRHVLARLHAPSVEHLGACARLQLRRRPARRDERLLPQVPASRPARPRSSTRTRSSATRSCRRSRGASSGPGPPTARRSPRRSTSSRTSRSSRARPRTRPTATSRSGGRC